MVAIKVVPHEGDLGEKVEVVRESLLSSSIQHPQIVSICTCTCISALVLQAMNKIIICSITPYSTRR